MRYCRSFTVNFSKVKHTKNYKLQRKSEEPLVVVVHRSLTRWIIDICGSSAILLAVHLARTTIEPLQRVSNKYRPTGSDHTWLRAIEADLGPLNFGFATACRKATTRDEWRHIVNTATLQRSTLWKKKKKKSKIYPKKTWIIILVSAHPAYKATWAVVMVRRPPVCLSISLSV